MSNGSERTPERCPHAPEGPDWAGLRELPTPKPDYEALIGRVRDDYSCTDALHRSLADAVEALLAEAADARARSKRLRKNRMKERAALVARINDYRAERDALRTQLDSMTVEWGVTMSGILGRRFKSEDVARRWCAHRDEKVVQRLVSPWTVVEGDDQ